jgi:hypothetical protein
MQFLSPFVYNGFTTEYLKFREKIPDDKNVSHINLKCELILTELILSKLVGILSYPYVFLGYSI